MEKWKELEFAYAKKLREYGKEERRKLYGEAYSEVSKLTVSRFASDLPEDRTAGTNAELVFAISKYLNKSDRVLEIGCGRGYTSFKLSPIVDSIVATEVALSSIIEAEELFKKQKITNTKVVECSAYDIAEKFVGEAFNAAISIDVMEHLHPEDAEDHMRQVYNLLSDNGRYLIIMPSRLSGPHDVTMEEFPESKVPLGFHLNESTYGEMIRLMKGIGYRKFKTFVYLKRKRKDPLVLRFPVAVSLFCEKLYGLISGFVQPRLLKKVISIRLVAIK